MIHAWHLDQHKTDAQKMAAVIIPLDSRAMRAGSWSGLSGQGVSWDSNTVTGAWRDIFEGSLISCLGVIHILIPSCSTNLSWVDCAWNWDYGNELDKAGPCPQEAYVFMSYLKEGRALPCLFSTSDK